MDPQAWSLWPGSIARAIRAVRLSNGQSRNSVSTTAEFFYLSSGFCPRSSHREAIINRRGGQEGRGQGPGVEPGPPQTDKIRLHRRGAGSGLSLGKWACAWISKFNGNRRSKRLPSPRPAPVPSFFPRPLSLSPSPSPFRSSRFSIALSVIRSGGTAKRGKKGTTTRLIR